MSSLRTDLLLDPFDARWTDLLAAAETAHDVGFDGIWTWDHLAGQVHQARGVLEAWTVLSALAARLDRISIGPLVLNVANRDPGLLAQMAATLQEVSDGRLLLGLGAGGGRATPYVIEQLALGRRVGSDPRRRRHVEETVGVLRQLWTGQARPVAGSSYGLAPASGFLRPAPCPPIIIGAFGPKMAELAGRVGDGINVPATHPRLAELIQRAQAAHSAAGRGDADFIVTVFAGLDDGWVDPRRGHRARLEELGVSRLIVLTSPPYNLARLRRAGELLGPRV